MTNEKRAHDSNDEEDSIEEDTSSEEGNKFQGICTMCLQEKSVCCKKRFSLYCIDAVENEFCISPLDNSTSNYTKVFTMAYNRALDYRKFQDDMKLMPHGQYYLSACMMAELSEFLVVLERDKG